MRAIGVSNFMPVHLDRLMKETTEVPAVNQIECHPYFTQQGVQIANGKHGILTPAQLDSIDGLDKGVRGGPEPENITLEARLRQESGGLQRCRRKYALPREPHPACRVNVGDNDHGSTAIVKAWQCTVATLGDRMRSLRSSSPGRGSGTVSRAGRPFSLVREPCRDQI